MLKSKLLHDNFEIGHQEKFWKTTDGLRLFTQSWLPSDKPKALINLIHSLGEHSGRYSEWASQLASEGFIVRSFDQRGHGKSEGRRGYSRDYSLLLKDINAFDVEGRKEFSSLPGFLYGHGLGGNLVLNYLLQYPQTMNGVIVSSPWLEMTTKSSAFLLMLVSFIGKILPVITFNTGLKSEYISRDLRAVHAYKTDPMVHNRIGTRLFSQACEAGQRAAISIYKMNVPLLVMHGTNDKIASFKTAQNFVRNAGSKTTFLEWEGGYHELHNDLDYHDVFRSLIKWLHRNI